jgi:maltose alpha-D-glucosyltransferase / alpha-amylase
VKLKSQSDSESVNQTTASRPLGPGWYKDAVIYQAHVRAFLDSTSDGVGDFPGLTTKLEYLEGLGIDTLWLLPFYPSPLRDDGYDIADYNSIHPAYGTLADFDRFVDEAHRRNIRVITELVINHTSDAHPWFQAARRAPAGSPAREFYVWSNTNQKYQGVPIIFSDTEKSNWTWDETAGAYYWHRFFSHQPDLNYDNPAVLEAVVEVMRFWLDRGVDGMRLDAVPYLIEREGTPCANLDETHAVLKRIRAEMDARHRDRVLLAEANQWPAEVRPYFGDGDECHMAFHFPLMPRMFMAVRQEDRHPIVEILRQTPDIPDTCQWGLFLRNHDELTLEMVTDEERDYMYQVYANDPQMRINGGIRRRLAPLMENSRRRIELMNSLLFSLPGTPVIYYGDELGMGDNIYLGDRNGVRTPMQWTGDRNAGFSRADAARLYAPVITDPIYGFSAVNVEAQEQAPFSLLSWMKRLIGLRKQHTVFGRGAIEFVSSPNRKVLAYIRRDETDTILCVANLSRSVQPVELDLSRFRGMVPVEMLGQTEFPRIGDQAYFLSLGAYGFNWFRLRQAAPAITERTTQDAALAVQDVPALLVGPVWDTLLDGTVRTLIERDLLGQFLQRQPWFQGSRPRAVRFKDWLTLRRGPEPIFLTIVEAELDDPAEDGGGAVSRQYFLPFAISSGESAKAIQDRFPHAVLARITGARKGAIYDAWHDARFADQVLEAAGTNAGVMLTRYGRFDLVQRNTFPPLRRASDTQTSVAKTVTGEGGTVYGNRLALKLFRRVEAGVHPEIEIGQQLADVGFTRVPVVAAVVDYARSGDPSSSIAMFTLPRQSIESQVDGWTHAMEWLGRFFDQVAARDLPAAAQETALPASVGEVMGDYLEIAAAIGRRTAEMHVALAAASHDPAFAPEPFGREDLATASDRALVLAERTLGKLDAALDATPLALPTDVAARARTLLDARERLFDTIRAAAAISPAATKTRVHADYRLGQILLAEGDVYIQNVEGHLAWPAAAQREKQSPLKDVASLLRSFGYAAQVALLTHATERPDQQAHLARWAQAWQKGVMASFLRSYYADASLTALPQDATDRETILRFFMIDRALRELDGELQNRAEWVGIPAGGLLDLLERR